MGTAVRFPVWKERKKDDGGNDMERFTLAQAAAWTKGEARGTAELTAVSTDSRQIPTEALFLPIRGERFDAHDFIAKAIENGAAAVVSHRQKTRRRRCSTLRAATGKCAAARWSA